MVSVSFRYLFYQLVDEKIKTWPLRFPIKENPNMEEALFDWPSVLQYDVKGKYQLSSTKFSGKSHARLYPFNESTSLCFVRFVCCLCFARAFSFQDHTKIAVCYFFFSCFVFLFVCFF